MYTISKYFYIRRWTEENLSRFAETIILNIKDIKSIPNSDDSAFLSSCSTQNLE